MKNVVITVCIIFLAVFFAAGSSFAVHFGDDITILDKVNKNATGWYGAQEDQEVEPGCVKGQQWDLEGFFLKENTLTMIGGYDFVNGEKGYYSGDIFIDVDGDAQFGPANKNSGGGHQLVSSTFGYDYVMDLDFDVMKYNLIELDNTSHLYTVFLSGNDESNPWRYADGGTEILAGQEILYIAGLSNVDVGLLGGTHNALSVDLSFLDSGTTFMSHFTMACGNDNLMGKGTTPVGEPATLLLLALSSLGMFGWKKMCK